MAVTTQAFRFVEVQIPDTGSAESQVRLFAECLRVREEWIVLPAPRGLAPDEAVRFSARLSAECVAAETIALTRPTVPV